MDAGPRLPGTDFATPAWSKWDTEYLAAAFAKGGRRDLTVAISEAEHFQYSTDRLLHGRNVGEKWERPRSITITLRGSVERARWRGGEMERGWRLRSPAAAHVALFASGGCQEGMKPSR